jgi:ABC-type lipoprotein release transport system permease subunit
MDAPLGDQHFLLRSFRARPAAESTRRLGSFLEDVSAYDPMIFTGVTAAVRLSAIVASWIPARRALRVDPLVALKDE